MKIDKSLINTLREDPKEAESRSHRILLRGGFIKQLASGVHTYLPLGWRVILRISNIIREELDRIGGQEMLMPAIAPKEIWQESGRWDEYGDDMFRLKDRKGRDYCLCPTHEEIVADIARTTVRSYRDLPQIWYQIQTKFRDELRPRFGVIRSRQFIMKDSYSLDQDPAGLDHSFELHRQAYTRIFKRCGLDFEVVNASGGLMGAGESKEFIAIVDIGEAQVVSCNKCDYRANIEAAVGVGVTELFNDEALAEVHTPGKKTVIEVSDFLKVSRKNLIKSIFFTAPDKKSILILLRGDYDINENIIKNIFGFSYRAASSEEIIRFFGAEPGYIGPYGKEGFDIHADDLLKGTKGMITGANKNEYHIKGLNIDRDIKVNKYLNLRYVKQADHCPNCDGELNIKNGLELGHIFKLGTKYSISLNAAFLDEYGERKPIVMGSYGIGLERIMACACEQKGDDKGTAWPVSIAPYELYLLVLNPSENDVKELADKWNAELIANQFRVLLDDRDISAGIKFNDSELLGIPIRLIVSPKAVKQGRFEVLTRESGELLEIERNDVIKKCCQIREELYRKLNE
ncbi:proline--tRNA ligase [candidate division WOR-3 bacterium RBG_13_43_14]|uniref:Proline--tRNA ligase n=1 Tax=candidate division WOR-3 bacterium RBG_13_43_14 TaxID=1802590 RepID=A0A1F4U2C1_UNCW3|nr:MAG: proline--tRNA ligase [candidate division WOR-3 bacterium RBG_13_43_14]